MGTITGAAAEQAIVNQNAPHAKPMQNLIARMILVLLNEVQERELFGDLRAKSQMIVTPIDAQSMSYIRSDATSLRRPGCMDFGRARFWCLKCRTWREN
jgi:hypothetical protein